MARFAEAGHPGNWMRMMRVAVEQGCGEARTLEAAAQGTVKGIYEQFIESLVLVRLFATIPYGDLPPAIQVSARDLAAQPLADSTPVLTLLGTYGTEELWRDRRGSRGHAGVPLVSAAFISSIPMMARVLEELGVDLKTFDAADRQPFVEAGLFKSGAFHVPDATTTTDARGRKIITAQDFVQRHQVGTVFGAGVAFLGTTTMATLICFTRDQLDAEVSQAALTALSQFRALTQPLVNGRKLLA